MLYNRVINNLNHNDVYSLTYAYSLYLKVGIIVLIFSMLIVLFTMLCPGLMICFVFLWLAFSFLLAGIMLFMNLVYNY